jgi:hypothetical protein
MSNKKQTAVEWYFEKIKSHFEHDGDLFETACMTYAIAKQKEREEMMKTWTKAIDQTQERAWNVIRSYDDFDDYYNETYGGNK